VKTHLASLMAKLGARNRYRGRSMRACDQQPQAAGLKQINSKSEAETKTIAASMYLAVFHGARR
jgi:hypothetical protein